MELYRRLTMSESAVVGYTQQELGLAAVRYLISKEVPDTSYRYFVFRQSEDIPDSHFTKLSARNKLVLKTLLPDEWISVAMALFEAAYVPDNYWLIPHREFGFFFDTLEEYMTALFNKVNYNYVPVKVPEITTLDCIHDLFYRY